VNGGVDGVGSGGSVAWVTVASPTIAAIAIVKAMVLYNGKLTRYFKDTEIV
jgi:hypothetical protein